MLRSLNSKQFHWLTFNLITTPHQVGNYLYIYDFLYILKKIIKKVCLIFTLHQIAYFG